MAVIICNLSTLITGLIFFAIPTSIVAQTITSTTLLEDHYACPGTEVVFNCTTIGSSAIAWRSVEYIGSNNAQLLFIGSTSQVGDFRTASSTVATLVAKYDTNDGDLVLVSTLRVVVSSGDSLNPSVTCLNAAQNVDTHNVIMLNAPNPLQEMISDQRKDVNDSCTIHVSWNHPKHPSVNISYYMIHVNGEVMFNETNDVGQDLTTTAFRTCSCGTHYVNVTAVSTFGCRGESVHAIVSSNTKHLYSSDVCTPQSRPTAGATAGEPIECEDDAVIKGLLGLFIVLFFVSMVITVVLANVIWCLVQKIKKQSKTNDRGGNKKESTPPKATEDVTPT